MRIWSKPRIAAGVIGLSVMLMISACASNSGWVANHNSNPSEGVTFTPGAKPTGAPITIGAIATVSGAFAGVRTGALEVAKAWSEWVNETQGGINGHPVQVVTADDKADPATGNDEVRKLVDSDGAIAIFAGADVSAGVMGNYLKAKKIGYFSSDTGNKPADAGPSWFSIDLGLANLPLAQSDVAKAAGFKSTVDVVCAEVATCKTMGDSQQDYGAKIGVQYKGALTIATTATDATAQCLQIVRSGANAVVSAVMQNPSLAVYRACRQQGFKGGFIQVAWADSNLANLPGEQFGLMYNFPWWADSQPVRLYNAVMKRYQPGVAYNSFGASHMWAELELFRAGMAKAGPAADKPVAASDVISAMYNGVKNETLGGLLPQPITFSPAGQTPITCFWVAKRTDKGIYSTLAPATSGNGATGDLASTCSQK